jgi:amino acid adenylation domain-containing protein
MSKRTIEAVYPLSPMQQGMLFHSLLAPQSGVYVEQLGCTFRGRLNVQAFSQAWQHVVNRHSILRTCFAWKSLEKPMQVVQREISIDLETQDWRNLNVATQQEEWNHFLKADRLRGFDLAKAPLMRLTLRQTAEDEFLFLWTHHHTLLDGWSLPLIFSEMLQSYEAFHRSSAPQLPAVRPFRDYIAWLQQQDYVEAEKFWRDYLRGFDTPTPLIADRSAESQEKNRVSEIHLSEQSTNELQTFAKQHQLTLNTLVQGAWALLLHRYSDEDDIVFGATVSGRPAELAGVEQIPGIFINTLPVRVRIQPTDKLMEWLRRLQQQQAEIRQREFSLLTDIQGWSEVPRGQSLFETILVFENYPMGESLRSFPGSVKIENIRVAEQTNYPLTFVSGPGKQLLLRIAYDASRFSETTIVRMLRHLQTLLESFASNTQTSLCDLPLLTNDEQAQLLTWGNGAVTDNDTPRCVHQLFEQQAMRTPDAVAVKSGEATLTYAELNQRANQVANFLCAQGVKVEDLIALCTERSVEMIIGLLGILKAGAAYVPIDPHYPAERIEYMLRDSGSHLVLTQERLADKFTGKLNNILCLDRDWNQIAEVSTENPLTAAHSDNLAYVIYTSGSTGQPKGVLIEHRGVCNLVCEHATAFEVSSASRVLQFASLSFDASVCEILTTLTSGAQLILVDRERLISPEEILRALKENLISVVTLPPTIWAALPEDSLPDLKTAVTAGEACRPEIAAKWSPGRRFINGYGPTETTVSPTFYVADERSADLGVIPIGRPMANTQIYILDKQQRLVPAGVSGELYVGGVGIARGYLHREELTAEKFITPNILSSDNRLYRTGDLARWLPDGNLEFLGRADGQVKLRGFRIETGEIESLLRSHPEIQDAVVVAREDVPGEKYLAAYLVVITERRIANTELRAFLSKHLPEYMIPSAFVTLESLPLTSNGKVNRKALPAPDAGTLTEGYIAPRTTTEELLAGIFARILRVERVGATDDFFALGGHSLVAAQVITRVREAYSVDLPLRELFENSSVSALAAQIDELVAVAQGQVMPSIERVSRSERLPLSFSQQRLWFLDQLEPDSPGYNNPAAVVLNGRLDVAALQESFNEIIRRHEILRTVYRMHNGEAVQVIREELRIDIPLTDISELNETERDEKARELVRAIAAEPMSLTEGPLVRFRLIRLSEVRQVAVLVMHHIISDGWSTEILLRELSALYAARINQQKAQLPELPIQYADYAAWQRAHLSGEHLAQHINYWKEHLRTADDVINLPTDRPRPAVVTGRGAALPFEIPAELTRKLRALSRQENLTLFMTLLGGLQLLLSRYSGQRSISTGSPVANRHQSEVENLIGFFVNTLVFCTDLSGDPDFRELLRRVRHITLEAYAHQAAPFEQVVEAVQPERSLSHTPLFQVMLVLNNFSGLRSQKLQMGDVQISGYDLPRETARFDLTFEISENRDTLSGSVEYNTDLYNRETVAQIVAHWQRLLAAMTADVTQKAFHVPLISDEELQQRTAEWRTGEKFPVREVAAHHLFEEYALTQPEAIALMLNGQQLTYATLNQQADLLANYLIKSGVEMEEIVGVMMGRSFEMITGILGTMKAGAAYLPLDPNYPAERLRYMIEDSGLRVLLTQQHLKARITELLPASSLVKVIALDAEAAPDAEAALDAGEPADHSSRIVTLHNLAYVIYTSGSTGRPKGTLLEHRGLVNLIAEQKRAFAIAPGTRVMQFAALSFDASVWEIFMTLGNGATLVLGDVEELVTSGQLAQWLRREGINIVTLPPTVLRLMEAENLPDLRIVISAGEACEPELVHKWATGRSFFNAYGPTETTVCASMELLRAEAIVAGHERVTIGRALRNVELHILDERRQPVPVGVTGELYVSGINLARGYLRREELTAEKFIRVRSPESGQQAAVSGQRGKENHRHGGTEGQRTTLNIEHRTPNVELSSDNRLYRTGDLARFLADGRVEYVGRVDEQVKIRGFRIELGEIESALREVLKVEEVVATVRNQANAGKQLIAYVVSKASGEGNHSVANSEWKKMLRERLPEYMLPGALVVLDAMPLLPNGKINRRALPDPDPDSLLAEREYIAPRTSVETDLVTVCQELLSLSRVGITDNFFELGGHSLLATQLLSRIRDRYGIELQLRLLFQSPTIEALASAIEQAQAETKRKQMEREKVAELMTQMKQLSPEQVKALLEERKAGIR